MTATRVVVGTITGGKVDGKVADGLGTTDDLLALFDMEPEPREPEPKLSDGRRLTIRQLQLLKVRRHPLTIVAARPLRLHPEAPPADDREAPGPRCGGCRFREIVPGGARSYPKCMRGWDGNPRHQPPYVSGGPATDLRSWWPACEHWKAKPE